MKALPTLWALLVVSRASFTSNPRVFNGVTFQLQVPVRNVYGSSELAIASPTAVALAPVPNFAVNQNYIHNQFALDSGVPQTFTFKKKITRTPITLHEHREPVRLRFQLQRTQDDRDVTVVRRPVHIQVQQNRVAVPTVLAVPIWHIPPPPPPLPPPPPPPPPSPPPPPPPPPPYRPPRRPARRHQENRGAGLAAQAARQGSRNRYDSVTRRQQSSGGVPTGPVTATVTVSSPGQIGLPPPQRGPGNRRGRPRGPPGINPNSPAAQAAAQAVVAAQAALEAQNSLLAQAAEAARAATQATVAQQAAVAARNAANTASANLGIPSPLPPGPPPGPPPGRGPGRPPF